MKKILLLFTSFIFISCAVKVNTVNLKERTYDEFPLNTELTKELGEKVVLKGVEQYQDAIMITERPPSINIYSINFSYPTGSILPLSGDVDKYLLYYNSKDLINGTGGDYYVGVAIEKKTNKAKPFYLLKGGMGGIYTKDYDDFIVTKATYVDPSCQRCFKQEFIYNGKVDSHLKFIYREYVNDMARPAFNQELQYDLNDSDVIGFKGVRIKIVEATNTSIKYEILNTFN